MCYGNLIDGRWLDGGERVANRNPADTRENVGYFVQGTAKDMRAAAEAAARAVSGWASMPAPARGAVLFRAADWLDQRFERTAEDMTREEGKRGDRAV